MLGHTGPKTWISAVILAFVIGAFVLMPGAYSQTGYGQVTLVNQTTMTLDLHTNGRYSCRALKGLSCTSQEKGGSISLVAKSDNGASASGAGTLKSGGTFIFTVTQK